VGTNTLPPPPPPGPFPMADFATNLFFAAFAYTGWNAAVYAAEEFEDPRRTVPRAMVIGTLLVTCAYLLISWVFVTNITAADMKGWGEYQATTAHLVVAKLLGEGAAIAVSLGLVVLLASSVNVITLIGPRVNAAMARDGFLPRAFAGREGKAPWSAILLQTALALVLLYTNRFDQLMANVGIVLTFSSALTVAGLFRARLDTRRSPRPGVMPLVAAAIYILGSSWALWKKLSMDPKSGLWLVAVTAVTLVAYVAARFFRRAPGS
jgi:APA family basic amino acid/polyamine antiporter